MNGRQFRQWTVSRLIAESQAVRLLLGSLLTIAVVLFATSTANAVPSYARQTGLACSSCHTTFFELTPFARAFKLHGYSTLGMKELEEAETDKAPPLTINRAFPLSVMLQTSLTRTNEQQSGTQNNNVEFPQQLSIFLAGEITPHIGTFLQATYTGQDDHFTLDNTDIRYANDTMIDGKELIYGVTLNNNPTVEDPWHSTPAWGFPFAAADAAPSPAASALVDGGLSQQVAGIGGYGMWNKHLYANATIYRSAHIGSSQPPTAASGSTIRDVAPYWRLAWQQNWGPNYLEVGTFGLFAQLFPADVSGTTDKFTDLAFDSQFERPLGKDFLSAHLTYIFENQNLDATHAGGGADRRTNKLHTFRVDGIYHLRSRLSFSLQYFLLRGTNDGTRYAPAAVADDPAQVSGSSIGSPDSDGATAEVAYFPWQNVRLSLQYTAYTEFNGRSNNYNGTGRDASGNNTLYLLAWLVY